MGREGKEKEGNGSLGTGREQGREDKKREGKGREEKYRLLITLILDDNISSLNHLCSDKVSRQLCLVHKS